MGQREREDNEIMNLENTFSHTFMCTDRTALGVQEQPSRALQSCAHGTGMLCFDFIFIRRMQLGVTYITKHPKTTHQVLGIWVP